MNHFCGHSLRILGEPLSMRAELGGIHFALEHTPVDEELTILTDSRSAIHLLCRWRHKRILTPYVRRAKCRDIVSAILERLLARTRAGSRTLFAKVLAHNSCELNATADRLAERKALRSPRTKGSLQSTTGTSVSNMLNGTLLHLR